MLDDLFLSDNVLNIAHRGGALLAPEETLEAFQNAFDVGADALELDLHSTSDGVIVCLHDDTVDRTTDGTGDVAAMTFDELRGLDAGYSFSTDDGATFPFRGSGLLVPTLEEVLDTFPNKFFVIEIKQDEPSIIADVIDVIAGRDMMGQVILASMTDNVIAEIRASVPDVHTSFATGEMVSYITMTDFERGHLRATGAVYPSAPCRDRGDVDGAGWAIRPEGPCMDGQRQRRHGAPDRARRRRSHHRRPSDSQRHPRPIVIQPLVRCDTRRWQEG